MNPKLIVLRGPSGSGKSTVARQLQHLSSRDTLIVDQDYYRHVLLMNKPDKKSIVPELIYHATITALNAGYDVIVEGIFRKEKYKPMFEKLKGSFDGKTYIYYFNISFEETVVRHGTRDKAALFGPEDMKQWYHLAEPLEIEGEQHIPEHSTQSDTVALIRAQVKL